MDENSPRPSAAGAKMAGSADLVAQARGHIPHSFATEIALDDAANANDRKASLTILFQPFRKRKGPASVLSAISKMCRPAALTALVVFALVQAAAQPVAVGRPASIVFAPWIDSGEAITRAATGARVLTRGGAPFAVIVVPEREDYAEMVAAKGAWFVTGLSRRAGCGSRTAIGS